MSFTDWLFDPLVRELRRALKKLGVIMADKLDEIIQEMQQGTAAVRAAATNIKSLDGTVEQLRDDVVHLLEAGDLTQAGADRLRPHIDDQKAALGELAQAVQDAITDDPNLPHPHPEP